MKIYVASSWRNERYPEVVALLRAEGYDVYDFRRPSPGNRGFHWGEIDPEWQSWTPEHFRRLLRGHSTVDTGFNDDMEALQDCDVCIYVLPCGRSASLEAGWAIGAGKLSIGLLASGEPELMFRMFDYLCTSIEEVCLILSKANREPCRTCDGQGCPDCTRCETCEGLGYLYEPASGLKVDCLSCAGTGKWPVALNQEA